MLKVYLCVPLTSVGLFTCMGPIRFLFALLHIDRAFYCHMGSFHPVRPPGSGGGVRDGLPGSALSMTARYCKQSRVLGVSAATCDGRTGLTTPQGEK